MKSTTHLPDYTLKSLALCAALLLSSLAVPADVQNTGIHRAIVTIPNPRSANLLQLRGFGGRGTAQVQIGTKCHDMPVRFVAGDFSGERVQLRASAPIVIEINAAQTVKDLLKGGDIVSDEADGIKIISGLSKDTGFVINPGRNVSADVFGTRVTKTPCDTPESSIAHATGAKR